MLALNCIHVHTHVKQSLLTKRLLKQKGLQVLLWLLLFAFTTNISCCFCFSHSIRFVCIIISAFIFFFTIYFSYTVSHSLSLSLYYAFLKFLFFLSQRFCFTNNYVFMYECIRTFINIYLNVYFSTYTYVNNILCMCICGCCYNKRRSHSHTHKCGYGFKAFLQVIMQILQYLTTQHSHNCRFMRMYMGLQIYELSININICMYYCRDRNIRESGSYTCYKRWKKKISNNSISSVTIKIIFQHPKYILNEKKKSYNRQMKKKKNRYYQNLKTFLCVLAVQMKKDLKKLKSICSV